MQMTTVTHVARPQNCPHEPTCETPSLLDIYIFMKRIKCPEVINLSEHSDVMLEHSSTFLHSRKESQVKRAGINYSTQPVQIIGYI